jgi:hypothetical protein
MINRIPFYRVLVLVIAFSPLSLFSQSDSAAIEKLRTESGVDPTRVATRVGLSILVQDQRERAGIITNRLAINLGVNRWSINAKLETAARTTGIPGTGFESSFGDFRLNILNAFFVKGKHALAANAEFLVPTAKPGFGQPYFSVTPALTYSYTINPTLFFAIQPQYTFDLISDPGYPDLSVLTIRTFLAKFTKTGYFFVLEPRPIIDFGNSKTDLVISPIIGKSLGSGFNLILLGEFPVTNNIHDTRGIVWQFGFNKNF